MGRVRGDWTARIPSSRRSCTIKSIAAHGDSRASSRVSPWPFAPGTSGQ